MATALLGTERRSLPAMEAPGATGRALAALQGDPDVHLLRAAGVLALARRAGRRAARDEGPVEEPCPPDPRPACPERPGEVLAWLLHREELRFLPEWLAQARAAGCRPPEEALPALLDAVRARPGLAAEVQAVGGPRAHWLAREGDFEAGTLEERALVLRFLRHRDPAGARALLESSWPGEAVASRVELLSALEVGLGLADEPFLEAALDDRRQEVRTRAAALLARMPGSALLARMKSRAAGVLAWEAGSLHVRVPTPDAPAARDGLPTRGRDGMGDKASWLRELLARTPPAWWEERLGADPRRLVEAARTSEWARALLEGWTAAAATARDPRWARALLDVPEELARLPEVVRALSPADREAVLLDCLTPRRLAEGDPRVTHLAACDHAWSAPFSRRMAVPLTRRVVRQGGKVPARLLEEVVLHVHPALLEDLREVLHEGEGPPQGRLAEVLDLLKLRLELRRSWQP